MEFSKFTFSSRNKEKKTFYKEANKKSCDALSKSGNTTEALMIYPMSAFELSPGDDGYLKFDDAITKYNLPTIKVYNAKKYMSI